MSTTLAHHITARTILGIDANCVPDPTLDLQRTSTSPYDNNGSTELAAVISSHNLYDVAREQLGRTNNFFTAHHTASNGSITSSRIDQIYAPRIDAIQWTHSSCHSFLPPRPESTSPRDHVAIQLTIHAITDKKGTDLPFIAENIFSSPKHTDAIANIIRKHFDPLNPPPNPPYTLAQLKLEIRHYGVTATAADRLKDTNETKQLKARISAQQSLIDQGIATQHTLDTIARNRTRLRDMSRPQRTLNDSVEYQAFQKGLYHDTGSAAMFRALTPRSADTWVKEIMDADWTDPSTPIPLDPLTHPPTTNPAHMADAFRKYYESLFARKSPTPDARDKARAALNAGRKTLPPTATACGAPITCTIVCEICKHLPIGKSPGPDRIPNAFYKNFADLLAPLLTLAYNQAHTGKGLPPQMIQGLITVLYKKKDRNDPRNYRPITLLNGDYKILMRILAQRLNIAILQFVSECQNGFVPDGFIAECSMLLTLLKAYIETDDNDTEGAAFIFLDMEKAFDRCSWEFLDMAIQDLGFPNEPNGDPHPLRQWIQLAYSHDNPPTRQMYVNGYLSKPFPLASGVAQGCPASPLLFIFFTEVLARLIEQDKLIKGIVIRGINHKLSQYADDTTLIARPNERHHRGPHSGKLRVEVHVETFCAATGGRENYTKREVYLAGAAKTNANLLPASIRRYIIPDGTPIRALGVPFGTFNELTWWWQRYAIVKSRVAHLININRMGITGRNIIAQSKFYGSLRYWLYSMIMPQPVIRALEQDIGALLWKRTPSLVPDETGTATQFHRHMIKPVSYRKQRQGGAGVMHWKSHTEAFYAQWIIKYMDPRLAPWKHVADHFLGNHHLIGRAFFLTKAGAHPDVANNLPPQLAYLKRCILSFQHLHLQRDLSVYGPEVQAEPLFGNPRLHIPLRPYSIQTWQQDIGCITIGDTLDTNTGLTFTPLQWTACFINDAPTRLHGRPSHADYVDARELELPIILNAITPAIAAVIHACDPSKYEYFALTSLVANAPRLFNIDHWVKRDDQGILHEQWLDTTMIVRLSFAFGGDVTLTEDSRPNRTGPRGTITTTAPHQRRHSNECSIMRLAGPRVAHRTWAFVSKFGCHCLRVESEIWGGEGSLKRGAPTQNEPQG